MFDNLSVPRSSSDIHVTSLGRRLLRFCQLYSIYILSGRVGEDKDIEHYTYIGENGCVGVRAVSLITQVTLLLRNVQNST